MNPHYPLAAERAAHRCEYSGAPEAVFNPNSEAAGSGAGFQPVSAGILPTMIWAGNNAVVCHHHRGLEACPTTEECNSTSDFGFNFPFEVEHILPPGRGGDDDESNWALACRACNLHKSDCVELTLARKRWFASSIPDGTAGASTSMRRARLAG